MFTTGDFLGSQLDSSNEAMMLLKVRTLLGASKLRGVQRSSFGAVPSSPSAPGLPPALDRLLAPAPAPAAANAANPLLGAVLESLLGHSSSLPAPVPAAAFKAPVVSSTSQAPATASLLREVLNMQAAAISSTTQSQAMACLLKYTPSPSPPSTVAARVQSQQLGSATNRVLEGWRKETALPPRHMSMQVQKKAEIPGAAAKRKIIGFPIAESIRKRTRVGRKAEERQAKRQKRNGGPVVTSRQRVPTTKKTNTSFPMPGLGMGPLEQTGGKILYTPKLHAKWKALDKQASTAKSLKTKSDKEKYVREMFARTLNQSL